MVDVDSKSMGEGREPNAGPSRRAPRSDVMSGVVAPKEREVVITRVFDAPRRLVFEAWTKPEHLVRWWGPRGFTLPTCEMDFRPGGTFRLIMRSPDCRDNGVQGAYREIVEPERIVFTAVLDDLPGEEILTTVTFAEHSGKTKLTVRQTVPASELHGRGQEQGWTETLDRLADYVARR